MISQQLALGAALPAGWAGTWSPGRLEFLEPAAIALACLLYLLGVARAWRKAGVGRGIGIGRALAGSLGFAALAAALLSPLDSQAALHFSAHMVQHLLLTLVAAPLLVLGVPLLAGLWLLAPQRRSGVVALWRRGALGSAWHSLSHPALAWLLFVVPMWAWHLPGAYQGALASRPLHLLEHATLLLGAGLFWWALLQPLGRRRLSRFGAPLVLFVTALQGGILGAMITLAAEPWYEHYSRLAAAAGRSALADQQLAGLLMWVPPGALYLAVACWLLHQALAGVDAGGGTGRNQSGTVPVRTTRRGSRLAAKRAPDDGGRRRSFLDRLSLLGPALLAGVAQGQVLRPAGPAAQGISTLWWAMLIAATVVCLAVFALFFGALFRRREAGGGRPPLGAGPFVVLGGVVIPLLILLPLLFWSLALTADVTRPSGDALTIEVIGHQWWWEVRYPEAQVTGANEIRIPAGRPVRLELTSQDVIHSFWAPGLQGKMDLVPGRVNELWIEADEPGIHAAKCAEFCGTQHANMRLLVVAEPEGSFREWLAGRSRPPRAPRDPLLREGQAVFMSSPCVGCHTIEGTAARGRVGPDLTHLAERMTLGAGTVANNRGNLGGWIVNSQAIKPGNRMPPMQLEPDELLALLAYLESLE